MAENFNIAKFLKENSLGSYGILGKYVDLHPLKEDSGYDDGKDNQYDGQYDAEHGPAIANENVEQEGFHRMMGLIDQSIVSKLPLLKKAVDTFDPMASGYKDSVKEQHKLYMNGICKEMASVKPNITRQKQYKIYIEELDRRRGTDYKKLFPFIAEWLDKI